MADIDLCTLGDLTDQFSSPSEDSQLVESLITAASRAIMRHPRVLREFTPKTTSATRTFAVRDGLVQLTSPVSDLRTVTTMTLHPEASTPTVLVAGTDYALAPLGGQDGAYQGIILARQLALCSDYSRAFGFSQLQIAGAWGLWDTAEVPEDIRRACAMTVSSWLDRGAQTYGVADVDEGVAFAPDRAVTYAVPTAALQLLAPYARLVYA